MSCPYNIHTNICKDTIYGVPTKNTNIMAKKVESIKHKADKRVHIPSIEEAGYEDANQKVKGGKKILELPKNPVVHRGQDPELYWMNKYGNDDRDELPVSYTHL